MKHFSGDDACVLSVKELFFFVSAARYLIGTYCRRAVYNSWYGQIRAVQHCSCLLHTRHSRKLSEYFIARSCVVQFILIIWRGRRCYVTMLSSDYMLVNGVLFDECRIGKDLEVSCCGLTEVLSQNSIGGYWERLRYMLVTIALLPMKNSALEFICFSFIYDPDQKWHANAGWLLNWKKNLWISYFYTRNAW
jgi:hypothetical protein